MESGHRCPFELKTSLTHLAGDGDEQFLSFIRHEEAARFPRLHAPNRCHFTAINSAAMSSLVFTFASASWTSPLSNLARKAFCAV